MTTHLQPADPAPRLDAPPTPPSPVVAGVTRGTLSRTPDFVRPTFEQLYLDACAWLPDALRRFGVKGDTEDLLHDVVILAHCRLAHFDPPRTSDPAHALRAWVRTIAWHHVTRRQRQAQRRSALLDSARVTEPVSQEPSVEDIAAAAERRRIWERVLAKITAGRAAVLVLDAAFEMTAPEIALELGLKENTVKSRLIRARRDALRAIQRLPQEHRSALQDLDQARRGAK